MKLDRVKLCCDGRGTRLQFLLSSNDVRRASDGSRSSLRQCAALLSGRVALLEQRHTDPEHGVVGLEFLQAAVCDCFVVHKPLHVTLEIGFFLLNAG
jgi:hypothetical protein